MKKKINELQRGLVAIIRLIVVMCFLFALGLNFVNVALRYGLHAPIFWAEEVMIFTFVWCTFLGMAACAVTGRHLRVDILHAFLTPGALARLDVVVSAVSAAVLLFVAWRAWAIVQLVWRFDQRSIVSETPMYVPYAAVLLGCVLTAFVLLLRALFGPADVEAEETSKGSVSI